MISESATSPVNLTRVPATEELQRLLASALARRETVFPSLHGDKLLTSRQYWHADYFGLYRSNIFQQATPSQQATIVQLANFELLQEIYWLETIGVNYMAKMVNWAETTQHKAIYTLFNAEAVYHRTQIMPFLTHYQIGGINRDFWCLLGNLLDSEEKIPLLFIFQVVLKGWSLSHYQNLSQQCQDLDLAKVLTSFLPEQSRHQITGITLFRQTTLSESSINEIVKVLTLMLKIIQTRSSMVIRVMMRVLSDLSSYQQKQLFTELEIEHCNRYLLDQFRTLVAKEKSGTIVEMLEKKGAFNTLITHHC